MAGTRIFLENAMPTSTNRMSFLFRKKTKTAIKWIWSFFAILIALSMIFAYSGGIGAS